MHKTQFGKYLKKSAEPDVRKSMDRRGLRWAARSLTRMTGKALPGQLPLYVSSPLTQLAWALMLFIGGILVSATLVTGQLPLGIYWRLSLLMISWLFTVSGARYLVIVIHHQCLHHQFSGSRFWDQVVGELVSLLTLTQDFSSYQADHIGDHHSKKLATLRDPDLRLLFELGFQPGTNVRTLWHHLCLTLIASRFHLKLIRFRLRSNFLTARPHRRIMAVGSWAALLSFAWFHHLLLAIILAYLFPTIFLYNISALLQYLSEHQWARIKLPGETDKLHLARLTKGRFVGEPAPPADLPIPQAIVAWIRWILRMLLIHLPARIFVLVGDLPAHDWHHRAPRIQSWPDALYGRQHDIDRGCPGWPEPPTEIWGLGNAIHQLFTFWASLPKMQQGSEDGNVTPPDVFVPLPPTFGVLDRLEKRDNRHA
ncbi:MAG TPA: fatty acid desaturase [Candidatus Angelobacter sp.]